MTIASRKKRFQFSKTSSLKLDSTGADVQALQSMLRAQGYLRTSYEPGEFCPGTERAVRRYQRFYGLVVDGVVGPITKGQLERPRCGVGDLLELATPTSPFVLRGCSYDKKRLTFAFLNDTADLPANRERQIVREAFGAWAEVTDLHFDEVQPSENPDFRIAWRAGDHGDGSSFDGPGNTLAHAFFPPPCGGPNAGTLHFDSGERWVDDGADDGIVLRQVALHEIGHLLGLSHSQDDQAIMYAFYAPDRTELTDDDIQGVRAIYGEPGARKPITLRAESTGKLDRTGAEASFAIEVPRALVISIDGPDNADFDLYVREGQAPTLEHWDFRAFTVSADERLIVPVEGGGTYHVLVRSYEGSGAFKLNVEPA